MKKAEIMKAAHAITRATVKPGDDYAVTLAAALRVCWSEPETVAAALLGDGAAEWASMDGAQQLGALLRMAWHEYKHDDARSIMRDGARIPLPALMDWINPAELSETLSAIANGAWIRMADFVADPAKAGRPLVRLLSRAVCMEARAMQRSERRNPSGLRSRPDPENPDGDPLEYIDAQSATAERIAPAPEEAAIIADSIARAARDDRDRAIIRLLARGYSNREIADALAVSHTAINKRVSAIRERYSAE